VSEQFLSRPILVNWSLSYRCNFVCRHCYTRLEEGAELGTDDCLTIGNKLADFGVIGVNFGGGEPLLRQDLFRLTRAFADRGLKVSMNSNGWLIDDAAAGAIRDAGFERVGVSLDGADAATHDAFRCQEGSYDKAKAALARLRERGVPVSVSIVVNRMNRGQIRQYLTQCRADGITTIFLHNFKGIGLGKLHADELDLPPAEWKAFYREALALKQEFHPALTISFDDPILASLPGFNDNGEKPAIRGSTCGKISLHVKPDGSITPCGFIPIAIGNALTDDLEKVWFESHVLSALRNKEPKEKCKGCKDYDWCLGGCSARALAGTGDFDMPDPHCWIGC
jgi:GeoRSP system radical SAM/SPASM protein